MRDKPYDTTQKIPNDKKCKKINMAEKVNNKAIFTIVFL